MSGDNLYIQASREISGEGGTKRDDVLWHEAMVLCEGNQEQARYKYINLRVEQLAGEGSGGATAATLKTAGRSLCSDPDYISIAKFSAKNTVSEKHLIQNIENGYYKGKQVAGIWWIYVGKNTFGTFEDRKESFFSTSAADKTESGRPTDDPGKVISIRKKK